MAADTTTVPEGHQVAVFSPTIEPSVQRSPGGVVIACFGLAGDDADRELAHVLTSVDKLLAENTTATLVNENRPLRVDELFAPAMPSTAETRSPISWVFHEGSVTSMMTSASRRESLFRFLHRAAAAGINQAVYVIDQPIPSVVSFVQLARGLDLELRQPDDSHGDLALQVEVKRPTGQVLTVLAGTPLPLDGIDLPYKPGELTELGPDELATRVRALDVEDRPISFRSPRLRERMIELRDSGDPGSVATLVELLLTRDVPVFMFRDPKRDAIELRGFGDETTVPVYADVMALEWAAVDLGKPKGSWIPGAVEPASLIAHAAASHHGIAVCTYIDRKTPMYAVVPAALVAALAQKLADNAPS